jgi:DNA cross-link repair 1C protein
MSTFDGLVKEFPTIRIDYFRNHPDKPPPHVCFLSHVHSDHLLGLESLNMPFVYCSSATRRLLLRIEKYPHRINFAKGILETRKQHYRHLKRVLRALPLYTATELELGTRSRIQVTLIDANHCPGAVMFLIQDNSKAILYTGDVRAEPWWVDSLVQNPFLLPFACSLKQLDCIYLDTTFSTHDNAYRHFPTKAEGLKELLTKVGEFPKDTTFYFRAWTLGYEQVWAALSSALTCRIHVDDYQLSLFSGINEDGHDGYSMFEGPSLMGYPVGNEYAPGSLTRNSETRLHSCEPGLPCHSKLKKGNVVYITPIISRLEDGTELLELGAGGGFGDLQQSSCLELPDAETLEAFLELCKEELGKDPDSEKIRELIDAARKSRLDRISLEDLQLRTLEELPLKQFAHLLSKVSSDNSGSRKPQIHAHSKSDRVIHFPFSRHSSYEELRHLVSLFRPRDVCPCTVDLETWSEDISMQSLFGDLCTAAVFYHDRETAARAKELQQQRAGRKNLKRKLPEDTQETAEDTQSQQDVYQSARASLQKSDESDGPHSRMEIDVTTSQDNSLSQSPLQSLGSAVTLPAQNKHLDATDARVRTSFRSLNKGLDLIGGSSGSIPQTSSAVAESQHSLTTSVFDSHSPPPRSIVGSSSPLVNDLDEQAYDEAERLNREAHAVRRKYAHQAARRALWSNESGHWDDLNLRSVGRSRHSVAEVEL